MASAWGPVGDVASVTQLVGVDAVSLIRMIIKVASDARMHRKNCRQFAHQLKLVGNLLEQLRISELRKHRSTREPLELLEDALRRSYILVNSCQDRSYLYLLVMGWDIAKQLGSAQAEIARYLDLIPLITLVDIQRVKERKENIRGDQHEYPLDGVEKNVQDPLSNPGRLIAETENNTKITNSNKHGLGINDVFCRIFKFKELQSATMNFSDENLLGQGGFGVVYKGWISAISLNAATSGRGFLKKGKEANSGLGTAIAVKRLSRFSRQGLPEALTEVQFLGKLSHPNVIKLFGYCSKEKKKKILLVYEFMNNGILAAHLFQNSQPLSWDLRIKIAVGAARGLAFLHASFIIHRDVKSSNILLDSNFNPKLSDFGLAMDGPTARDSNVEADLCGTFGYLAPEYFESGVVNHKIDVFGFGVVLLEMLSGKRASDIILASEENSQTSQPSEENSQTSQPSEETLEYVHQPTGQSFQEIFISSCLTDYTKLHRIMDPSLNGQYPLRAAFLVAQLARSCVGADPTGRPSMEEAVKTLEQIQTMGMSPTSLGPTNVSDPCPFLHDIHFSDSRVMVHGPAPFDADVELSFSNCK
ncbi:probable serine/threonine-protein kinase PIX13 [Musa acuminata AAA Group]|uniref:probable serine/threonine-protein kinase PIX13 n=1 Tax=Musa acuminata AAA Group TaxID=214697 RepID=UPI0031D4D6A9